MPHKRTYLHVEALGLLDERGGHGQEHDVGVQVRWAVIRVKALDAGVVHLADDGRHNVETSETATPHTRHVMTFECMFKYIGARCDDI